MVQVVALSFTAVLDHVAAGTLTEQELGDAIFCFGCTKDWPFEEAVKIISRHRKYQRETITPEIVGKVSESLRKAASEGRAVWRRDSTPRETQNALSKIFEARGLSPLNPNLPPADENGFLKIAIERVNNKNGLRRVRVIVAYPDPE